MKPVTKALVAVAAMAATLSIPAAAQAGTHHGIAHPKDQCIVSMSPTATDTLYAIGAGKQVEAVDDDSTGKHLPKKRIDAFNPSAEAIAGICRVTALHTTSAPTFVVSGYDANRIDEQLVTLDIPVAFQPGPATLSGAYHQILRLGALSGHRRRARALVATLKATLRHDEASIPKYKGRTLRAYYELDTSLDSVASPTFIGQILQDFGVDNIANAANKASDEGYPELSKEYLLTTNPQLVFLADHDCCQVTVQNFGARVGFASLSAVQHGHVVIIDDNTASRWGPSLQYLENDVAKGVRQTLNDHHVWTK
jgi:iron complex transport system substrate-binding protein